MSGLDHQLVRRWLAILHGDAPGNVHIASTGDWAGRAFPTDQPDVATAYVADLHAAGREGIYARVTTLRGPLEPGKRGSAADSLALPALWADLDLAGPGHAEQNLPPDEAAGQKIITTSGLPEPTIWVHSGGGLYPIWLLDHAHLIDDDLQDVKDLAAGWQRAIEHATTQLGWHYGTGVGDLARVLRIPGTINRKAGLQRPCRILSATARRYTLDELYAALADTLAAIPEPEPATPPSPSTDGSVSPGDDYAARTDWADILEPHGWTLAFQREQVRYWTRPGKRSGISATTNALGTDRLHIFTTSTNFAAGVSYSKLGAYAELEHGGDHRTAARALSAAGYGRRPRLLGADPAAEQRALLAAILGTTTTTASPAPAPAPAKQPIRPRLNVSNEGEMAEWLRTQLGAGPLSGMFARGPAIVYTPQVGEQGYQPLSEHTGDDDGPAQVRPVTASTLASRVQYRYDCFRVIKRGDQYVEAPALFPTRAARVPVDVPDELPNLRRLRGVIHTPLIRPDGTLLTAPGYDPGTGLLHLPEPGLTVPAVPDRPTVGDVKAAAGLIGEMIAGFPFVSEHHRANYVGLLLTPLLRTLAPPPYKLGAIEAHQPGSGKSLLAWILRAIHGGVVRSEMPDEDAELSKQLTAILMVTTGPVVTWDNVSGLVRSSVLAGLLTERWLSDRPLGVTDFRSFANDRLWTVTGNNMALGGDLSRRTIGIMIDPGIPQPEKREDFAIPDLKSWVENRRGELLRALLILIRAWVLEGQPVTAAGSDGYARWVGSVRAILDIAGIGGTFDHNNTTREGVGADDEEWREFLIAIHRVMGDRPWAVKELLGNVGGNDLLNPSPIALDELPDDLATKAMRSPHGVGAIAKSLGWWLTNRAGRWAGQLCVRSAGQDGHAKVKMWRIQAYGQQSD